MAETTQTTALFCTTTFDIPGYRIERSIGLCWGLVVRSMGFGRGFTASFRSLANTEIPEYTRTLDETRHEAERRLQLHARELGGNAVVGVRFDSTEVSQGVQEIVAYGTAVIAHQLPDAGA